MLKPVPKKILLALPAVEEAAFESDRSEPVEQSKVEIVNGVPRVVIAKKSDDAKEIQEAYIA